jgi:hypothetical protein
MAFINPFDRSYKCNVTLAILINNKSNSNKNQCNGNSSSDVCGGSDVVATRAMSKNDEKVQSNSPSHQTDNDAFQS